MRTLTRPSTAHCDPKMYVSYLLSDPYNATCTRLADIMQTVSHDSINRFLLREHFSGKELFEEVKPSIELNGGIVSVDDTILDKPYSDPKTTALVDYFWSGKHHAVVKGCCLVTLFYTDPNRVRTPVNYRLVDKQEKKSKNEYFIEMLDEVLAWGLSPLYVTGDAWYASLNNLKQVRKRQLNFLFGIDANRIISIQKGTYQQVQSLDEYPLQGRVVYLKEYGNIRLFRQMQKNQCRYYILGVANLEELDDTNDDDFDCIHQAHWHIEEFHRAIKQTCNIEKFQVRTYSAVKTHIHCALLAFIQLELLTAKNMIVHWYQLKRDMFVETIRDFVNDNPLADFSVHAY